MAQNITSRRLVVLGLVGITALLLLFALPTTTLALPDYAAKTGQACGVCHVNPAGGGALTPRGQAFAAVPNHTTDPAGAFAASAPAAAPTAAPTAAPAAATPTRAPAAATAVPAAATPTRAPVAPAAATATPRPPAATTAAPAVTTAAPTATLPKSGGFPLPFVPAALLSALALGVGIYLRRR